MATETLLVDPRPLHLPPTRLHGADPLTLLRQTARYGSTIVGMPRLMVYRAADGALVIADGVTRATRTAQQLPGTRIEVEVIGTLAKPCGQLPRIEDTLR